MGFEIKDLYTKSGADLLNMLFSKNGISENAVPFCEYVNKVGVEEVLNSNLGSAITSLSDNDYLSCYLSTVDYALDFMKGVREKESKGEDIPRVPAMWNILQSAKKLDDYDEMHAQITKFAKVLEEYLSDTPTFFEYAYAVNHSFCTRTIGSVGIITDEYVDHILNRYHYCQKDKEKALQDYSIEHLNMLMDKAEFPPLKRKEMIEHAKETMNSNRTVGPMFMRLSRVKLDKDSLASSVGDIIANALSDRENLLGDFFDEKVPKVETESSKAEDSVEIIVPKDKKGNTLQ